MNNDDRTKFLFENGCTEPLDPNGFRDRVMSHIGSSQASYRHIRTKDKILNLLMSPVPLIVGVAFALFLFRKYLPGLLVKLYGIRIPFVESDISSDAIFVLICCLMSLVIVVIFLKGLSEDNMAIDMEKIRCEVGSKPRR